jgi:hypothetical protein
MIHIVPVLQGSVNIINDYCLVLIFVNLNLNYLHQFCLWNLMLSWFITVLVTFIGCHSH